MLKLEFVEMITGNETKMEYEREGDPEDGEGRKLPSIRRRKKN